MSRTFSRRSWSVSGFAYSFLNSRLKAIVYDMQLAANSILLFIADGMPEDENLKINGGTPTEDLK